MSSAGGCDFLTLCISLTVRQTDGDLERPLILLPQRKSLDSFSSAEEFLSFCLLSWRSPLSAGKNPKLTP